MFMENQHLKGSELRADPIKDDLTRLTVGAMLLLGLESNLPRCDGIKLASSGSGSPAPPPVQWRMRRKPGDPFNIVFRSLLRDKGENLL
ncbi:unnamed protein product [Arctia plantaginis]|uniref:Uncharacterized protein n=1 Tax=Arctia plantaginis TaxID=874455 RepID=A0A8S1B5I9_ARCPL|nr:unnamed protein product [Arctia plantaginis]